MHLLFRLAFGVAAVALLLRPLPARAAPAAALAENWWLIAAILGALAVGAGAGYALARRRSTAAGILRRRPDVLTGTDLEADYDRMLEAVSERLEARRRALRESESLLRLMMDALPTAVFYLDHGLRFRLSNSTFETWFGVARDELAGGELKSVLGRDTYRRILPDIERAAAGPPVSLELNMPVGGDGERYIVCSIVRNLDDSGELQGFFVALDDLTERKRAEDAVAVARDAAERADAAKTRFLAAASHDLRQPLHAMRLLTGVLKSRVGAGPEANVIADLSVSLQSMEGMLNALLDISQLESGVISPEMADFPVDEILHRVEREFAPQAREHGLDFRVVPSSAVAHTDLALLERIVANFVSNAIRYTARGGIIVGCRRAGDKLRIEVWDTGIGIPDDQIGAIFEEYYQVANPARDRSKGLGLGLALVERLARTLGHRIACRSVAGKGSVFLVELPAGSEFADSADHALPAAAAGDLAGRRVLVVEDDAAGLNAMRLWLAGMGAEVVPAVTGADVDAVLKDARFDCDLILTDHRLPNRVTGAEVVRRVHKALGREVPAIVLTGDTAPEIRKEAEMSGFGFARKPIDPDQLLDEIRTLLPMSPPRRSAAAS